MQVSREQLEIEARWVPKDHQ